MQGGKPTVFVIKNGKLIESATTPPTIKQANGFLEHGEDAWGEKVGGKTFSIL